MTRRWRIWGSGWYFWNTDRLPARSPAESTRSFLPLPKRLRRSGIGKGGSMTASFLITLREGLEASLIISIILAFLARMGRKAQFRSIWLGTGLALLASLAAGGVIFLTVGALEGRPEEIFEGLAMFLAVGGLGYMVLGMRRQARHMKAHLEAQVKEALMAGSALALASLAFVVVVREGVEAGLFLFGAV